MYGHIDYVFQFHVYNERRPLAIPETFGHKSPWLDYDDVRKSGVLVGKSKKNLIRYADDMKSRISDSSKTVPEKYKFSITNKLGKTKNYAFYYTIIPSKK